MKKALLFTLLSLAFLPEKTSAQVGRWYSYADYVVNNAMATTGDYELHRNALWNDTTSIVYYSSGYERNRFVSMGLSFAPRLSAWDDVSAFGSSIKVGPTDAFVIDSVRIQGTYYRNNLITSPKDTLKFAFVYGNGVAPSNLANAGMTASHYGAINFIDMLYDSVKNIAGKHPSLTTAPYTQYALLSNTDTAAVFYKSYALTTPFNVPAGQCASMSLTFKSGDGSYPPTGDTVEYASGAYKHGAFQPHTINYAFGGAPDWAPFSAIDSNMGYFKSLPQTMGWSGFYIPQWAWSSAGGPSILQVPVIDYHIKCVTCRLNDNITGTATLCQGATTTLSHSLTGGTWSSSGTGVATVSSGGLVSGIAGGIVTITYNVSGNFTTTNVTVTPLPTAGTIIGASTVCEGSSVSLFDATPGGTWSSSAPGIASVAAGIVSGIAGGTATISYTVSNSCGSATATKAMTVDPLPSAGTITGATTVCVGATITLASTVPGGTWSSVLGNATVTSGGVVTGVVLGTDIIIYTVNNACGTGTTNVVVAIDPSPVVGVTSGLDNVCIGNTITLSNTVGGGTWTASNTNATVSSTGDVTGVAAGTVTITYAVTNSCGSATTQKDITIIDCSAGVHDLVGIGAGASIYPNPTRNNITITAADRIQTVVISNMVGQKVFSGVYNATDVTINLEHLPQGVYTVKINDSKVYKVIRQ